VDTEPRGNAGQETGAAQADPIKRISVIAPMLNEAAHIEHFVADLAGQDFSGEVELLVADGGSTDGSVAKLEAAAEQADLLLTMIDNPARWVSHGLNACIRGAKGDLIARLDCHSRYPPEYLRLCAAAAEETGAWCVGGIIVAQGETATQRAVACAMDTPFGGIGFYRVLEPGDGLLQRLSGALGIAAGRNEDAPARIESDTLTFGAFRPQAFQRVGFFDESLKRNQDDELTLRMRRAGGKVILDSGLHVHYTPRGSLRAVFRQYYEYGYWKVPIMLKYRTPPNPRALAPIVFLSSLLVLAAVAAAKPGARRLLAAELALYGAAALGIGALCVRRRNEQWRLIPRVAAIFPAFHLGYGAGMLSGAGRAVRDGVRARFASER
jgi:succinoglycan biosynthesis protein ExoA